jgi:hypothetical protein
MSDLLQFTACFLLPVGITLFLSVFFGWIGALGGALIISALLLWFIGREISLTKQRDAVEAFNRAQTTGWTDAERKAMNG